MVLALLARTTTRKHPRTNKKTLHPHMRTKGSNISRYHLNSPAHYCPGTLVTLTARQTRLHSRHILPSLSGLAITG